MLESVYPIITIVGVTALSVIFYFNHLLKRVLKILTLLLKIKSNANLDIQEYINSVELQLREIGMYTIVYNLSYSHSTILHETPPQKGNSLVKKELEERLVKGYIGLHVDKNRGEQKILNSLILHIVSLQIINQIHTKIDITHESFKKIAKLQTYMIHDLKNILQFFQAMQYNVQNIQTDTEKSHFIDYLQNNTEPINRKVNHILALLKVRSSVLEEKNREDISLKGVFEEYARYYNLETTIVGDFVMCVDKIHLQTIVDNIFGNIYSKNLLEKGVKVVVEVVQNETDVSISISDSGSEFIKPLEVCEPFYTTKQDGIGIGMYQVACIVELLEGNIVCQNVHKHPNVIITLPNIK